MSNRIHRLESLSKQTSISFISAIVAIALILLIISSEITRVETRYALYPFFGISVLLSIVVPMLYMLYMHFYKQKRKQAFNFKIPIKNIYELPRLIFKMLTSELFCILCLIIAFALTFIDKSEDINTVIYVFSSLVIANVAYNFIMYK